MGTLAQEFATVTAKTSSPDQGRVDPNAYGASVGDATSQLGRRVSDHGNQVVNLASQLGDLHVKEQESSARAAGVQYELGLQEILLDLEQTTDHNEWQKEWDKRSELLRQRHDSGFNGRAGRLYKDRTDLAKARQGIKMRTGVQKRRVDKRRGDVLISIDGLIDLGSGRPEQEHSSYLDEIGTVLDQAEQDHLLPSDEVARLRLWSGTQMSSRFEAKRISNEADDAVAKVLEIWQISESDENPDNDYSDAALLKMFGRIKDGRVRDRAISRFKAQKSLITAAQYERTKEIYGEVFNGFRYGTMTDEDIPPELPPAEQRQLMADWNMFQRRGLGNKEIITDNETHEELMSLFTAEDQSNFMSYRLHMVRYKLSDSDYAWFESRQKALLSGSGEEDKRAYSGDAKWIANTIISSSQEDSVNNSKRAASMKLEVSKALEIKQQQMRESTRNPNYRLTDEDVESVTDKLIIDRAVESAHWWQSDIPYPELTTKQAQDIIDDPDHDLMIQLTTDMNENRPKGYPIYQPTDRAVKKAAIDYFVMRGASF